MKDNIIYFNAISQKFLDLLWYYSGRRLNESHPPQYVLIQLNG